MRIAYLVRRFPVRSETFIIREIADHIAAGVDIDVISILPRSDADDVKLDAAIERRVTYLDLPSTNRGKLARAISIGWRHPDSLCKTYKNAIKLHRNRHNRLELVYLAAALSRLDINRYDVLHCHFGPVGRVAAILRKAGIFRGKLVASIHGYDLSLSRFGDFSNYYRILFDNVDLLLPVSEYWRDKLVGVGCDADKIRVQHMGVDLNVLSPPAPVSRPGLVLLSIGRMVEKKGHIFIVRALADLAKRRPDLHVRLEIIGDGPLRAPIASEAASLGLGDRVRLHGPQSHGAALKALGDCDIFVLPSVTAENGDMEGIPVALMEAMALEKPVISSYHSGIPELVSDEESGLLASERDVPAISHLIERLAEDRELRKPLGAAGRVKVERDFNSAKLGRSLRRHYERLTTGDELSELARC